MINRIIMIITLNYKDFSTEQQNTLILFVIFA